MQQGVAVTDAVVQEREDVGSAGSPAGEDHRLDPNGVAGEGQGVAMVARALGRGALLTTIAIRCRCDQGGSHRAPRCQTPGGLVARHPKRR